MPGATTTLVPDKVIPGLVEDTKVVVIFDGITGEPLSVSFVKTLVKEVPPVNPLTKVPVSLTAFITRAILQLVGLIADLKTAFK